MPDLKLTLPERETKSGRTSTAITVLLCLVLIVGIVNIIVTLSRGGAAPPPAGSGLSAEAQKDLAMKLEKQGLALPAVQAWEEYLAVAQPDTEERAKVWYRIGVLQQGADQHEKALQSYYTSESFAKLDDLAPEISRRIQECLEARGKFAALRHELAERVGVGEQKTADRDEIVAEIGPQKITRADLDRRIEEMIERQLARFAAYMPEDQRNKQKEALLKRFASAKERLQMLNQYVVEEILYRKARANKLADDPPTRSLLQDAERGILAQRVIEKEFADQIRITAGDLKTYYEAHKKEYMQPERAQISHILVKDQKAAEDALKKLKEGKDFAAVARELSQDNATKEKGGDIAGWLERNSSIPGIGDSTEATAAIFKTEAGKVIDKPIKTDKGFHIILVRARESERQMPFDEVEAEVYRSLRGQKEREVQEQLFEELKRQYNVVIHFSKFQDKTPEAQKPQEEKKAK
ncbi:MAG: peptidyl-prolyl cis-trans isomerase [Planctomycetota bacterium]